MQQINIADWLNANPDWGNVQKLKTFNDVLEKIPLLSNNGPWLVGGTVRRIMHGEALETDFDIMFRDAKQFDDFCGLMRERGYDTIKDEPNHITFDVDGWDVQAIRAAFYPTLIQTLKAFDFTICQFGFDGSKFVWGDEASQHTTERKLVFVKTDDPISTFRRVFKYAKQGFYMDTDAIAAFLKAMTKEEKSIEAAEVKHKNIPFGSSDPHLADRILDRYYNGGLTPPGMSVPYVTVNTPGPQHSFTMEALMDMMRKVQPDPDEGAYIRDIPRRYFEGGRVRQG